MLFSCDTTTFVELDNVNAARGKFYWGNAITGCLSGDTGRDSSLLQVRFALRTLLNHPSSICSLLNCKDTQVIQVVLDGLNNMLKLAGPDVSLNPWSCTQLLIEDSNLHNLYLNFRWKPWRQWWKNVEASTKSRVFKIMKMSRSTSLPTRSSSSTLATMQRRMLRWYLPPKLKTYQLI